MDAAGWNERYEQAPHEWGTDANRWVVQELGALTPTKAVDLAAGEGRNSIWLASEGWSVTAVDFSSVAIDRAREQAAQRAEYLHREFDIDWRVEEITKVELEQSTYHAVLMCYLQLPAYERRDALRVGARALSPGGVMLVVAHDPTNIEEGYGGPQDPEILYSAEDIQEDLQDYLSSGTMVVERAGRVAREIETENGTQYAWDVLVKLKGRDIHKGEVTFD